MAQQTAVEWLEKICQDRGYFLMSEYFEQAKEMEKDQICEAWQHGKQQTFLGLARVLTSEQYYDETYNK